MEGEPQRAPSGNSVHSARSVLSQVMGGQGQEDQIDEEELVARGYSQQQVDAVQAQRYQMEVLQRHVRRWRMVLLCCLCLLVPAMCGVTIWLIFAWGEARSKQLTCDTWLVEWVSVVYVLLIYKVLINDCVLKYVCKFNQAQHQQTGTPVPVRVKLYNMIFPVFDFIWKITGICLTVNSGDCSKLSGNLYKAVLVYSSLGLFMTVFFLVNAIGMTSLLSFMMRNGMLSNSTTAAPQGTLEAQKLVPFDADKMGDDAQCSICLEYYTSKDSIRETHCGHCFHSKCLKGWLGVNHNCPLCRQDLTKPAECDAIAAEPDPEAGHVLAQQVGQMCL